MTDFIVIASLIVLSIGTFLLWRERKRFEEAERRERAYLKSLGEKNPE